MMFNFLRFGFYCILCILLTTACKKEPKVKIGDLNGKWLIDSAERDGKSTKSLQKGYFQFLENQSMHSNVMNTTDTLSYSVEGNKIIIENLDYKFLILHFANDSLSLRTRINKSNYKMNLLKS